jgi:mannan endo-1,4-beta-mannosidase
MPSSSDRPPQSPPESAGGSAGESAEPELLGEATPEPPESPGDGIHESNGVYESDDGIYDEDPEDASGGAWRLSRLNMGLLCLSVAALSAALYISPAGSDVRDKVQEALPGSTLGKVIAKPEVTPSSVPSGTPSSTATRTAGPRLGPSVAGTRRPRGAGSSAGSGASSTNGTGTVSGVSALSPLPTAGSGGHGDASGSGTGASAGLSPLPTSTATPPSKPTPVPTLAPPVPTTKPKPPVPAPKPTPKPTPASTAPPTPKPAPSTSASPAALTKCYQFTWQQDAQAVYLLNLSDPYGLDADPGPNNGDGLACTGLPVDPARAPSAPAAAYSPPRPSVAAKRALVSPDKDYFGFLQDGVHGDAAALQGLSTSAGKAPSTTGWFSTFDEPYHPDQVEQSWSRGALPVVTWMPVDSGSGASYSLSSIIKGDHDAYLRRYAGDVVREGLPVSLRFGHEMNGGWYGWSAGQTAWNNTPAKYVAAWQHVWQVFDEVGATDDVIWLWSPARVDNLRPSATNGVSSLADDYPGDKYVDWVGASVYLRQPSVDGATYAASFGKTVTALKAVTDKPIFFGEIGAAQTEAGVDRTTAKTAWIQDVLTQLAADDQVVGFLWFNNVAATVINGVSVTNDWRFDASQATQDAFKQAIETPAYAEGMAPD